MTYEATLMIETGPAIPFTVADTAMPKGTLCQMTDPFTASATAVTTSLPCAGIAKNEKIVDGKLTHAIYRGGIFKVYVSGSVTAGDALTNSTLANLLEKAATNEEDIWGTALETATTLQSCLFELKPMGISLA